MRMKMLLTAALAATMLGGCATYSPDGYYVYDGWGGYEGRDHRHGRSSGGGRSEPGNEAGMYPGRPRDGRGTTGVGSGRGDSRGGEAGM